MSVNSGYNGALAGEILVQAFKKSDTIAKGAITVLPNNIGVGYLPKISFTGDLVDYSCGFEGAATTSYVDKSVTLRKFKIEDNLCKNDYQQTFQAQTSGLFAGTDGMPASIQESILLAMVNSAGAKVDTAIWQGAVGTASLGLLAQFVADADVIDVSGSVVTAANAIAQFASASAAIPAGIEDEDDLVFVVSKNVAKAYKQAQANLVGASPVGDKELDYLGTKVISVGGLPNNTIVAYRVKNVAFLTGLEADLNDVMIEDRQMEGDIRTKMVFAFGVGYSFGNEIVYQRVIS
jgi:hypothetical protein